MNTQIPPSNTGKQNKSMLWKFGMVYVSFLASIIIVITLLGFVSAIVIMVSVNPLLTIDSVQFIPRWSLTLLMFAIGLGGLNLGIKYVLKKAEVTRQDVKSIISWFIVFQSFFTIINISDIDLQTLLINIVTLILYCYAIKYFFTRVTTS